jgi:hypothetical protein
MTKSTNERIRKIPNQLQGNGEGNGNDKTWTYRIDANASSDERFFNVLVLMVMAAVGAVGASIQKRFGYENSALVEKRGQIVSFSCSTEEKNRQVVTNSTDTTANVR